MASENEAFDLLEQRVQRAVELTSELRAENSRLKHDVEELRARVRLADSDREEADTMRASISRLESEVATYQKERESVRTRVERLLQQIDSLSA